MLAIPGFKRSERVIVPAMLPTTTTPTRLNQVRKRSSPGNLQAKSPLTESVRLGANPVNQVVWHQGGLGSRTAEARLWHVLVLLVGYTGPRWARQPPCASATST
jgi:hypothetical protein